MKLLHKCHLLELLHKCKLISKGKLSKNFKKHPLPLKGQTTMDMSWFIQYD